MLQVQCTLGVCVDTMLDCPGSQISVMMCMLKGGTVIDISPIYPMLLHKWCTPFFFLMLTTHLQVSFEDFKEFASLRKELHKLQVALEFYQKTTGQFGIADLKVGNP